MEATDKETGLPAEKRAELEQKYGARGDGWDVVQTVAGPVAARCPNGPEWDKFLARLFNDQTKHLAGKLLACECVVYPENFLDRLDRKPGMQAAVVKMVNRLAGQVEDAEGKG